MDCIQQVFPAFGDCPKHQQRRDPLVARGDVFHFATMVVCIIHPPGVMVDDATAVIIDVVVFLAHLALFLIQHHLVIQL